MDPSPQSRPKRFQKPRVLLSCSACRRDKLKCDRGQPCISCVRRNRHNLCVYISDRSAHKHSPHTNGAQRAGSSSRDSQGSSSGSQDAFNSSQKHLLQSDLEDNRNGATTVTSSTFGDVQRPVAGQAAYLSSNHWRSIGGDATGDAALANTRFPDDGIDRQRTRSSKPFLLKALASENPVSERLGMLPPREEADALVAYFLESSQPATICVHPPTFQKEYLEFWNRPQDADPAWIALFYAILACGVWMDYSTDPESSGPDLPVKFEMFMTQCAAFLALSDFTVPGPYKVDAATLYLEMEYVRVEVLKTDMSVLMGLISRQAIVSGYHKSPYNYPGMPVFEAEMRRRTWLVLIVTDCTVAYETGLPRVIPHGLYNVEYPRNLLDHDMDPSMSTLPPERVATTDCHRITYMIKLNSILSIGSDIPDSATDAGTLADATEKLNEKLEAIWRSVPSVLRFPRAKSAKLDDNMTIWRSNLENTYQRTRSVLHRPFLSHRSKDYESTRRRDTCVQSALRIVHVANQVLPKLLRKAPFRHRVWFCASRSVSDVLTAAMVICLELTYRAKDHESSPLVMPAASDDLTEPLRSLERTWNWAQNRSPLIRRSVKVLTALLRHMGISPPDHNDASNDNIDGESGRYRENMRVEDTVDVSAYPLQHADSTNNDPLLQGPIHELIYGDYQDEVFDWDLWDHEMHLLDYPVQ